MSIWSAPWHNMTLTTQIVWVVNVKLYICTIFTWFFRSFSTASTWTVAVVGFSACLASWSSTTWLARSTLVPSKNLLTWQRNTGTVPLPAIWPTCWLEMNSRRSVRLPLVFVARQTQAQIQLIVGFGVWLPALFHRHVASTEISWSNYQIRFRDIMSRSHNGKLSRFWVLEAFVDAERHERC